MSKLIDADALLIAVNDVRCSDMGAETLEARYGRRRTLSRIETKVNCLPDASLSLREELAQKDARIKELEAGLGRLLSASKDVYDDSYGVNGEAYTIASKEAEILLGLELGR